MSLPETVTQLAKKYAGQGPRYTSYPTAVEFSPSFTSGDWQELLRGAHQSCNDYSLYVHLPFCASLCYFCACHKVIVRDRGVVAPYLEALNSEIQLVRNQLIGTDLRDSQVGSSTPRITQLHFGGGSPSYLDTEELTSVVGQILTAFPRLSDDPDISIELDPRTCDIKKLQCLKQLGFNRVSFGVQDFDEHVQTIINRIQPYELTRDLILAARELGFSSINIDLIYGLPDQTEKGFADTLDKVCQLRPDRLALYGYAHVTWKTKVQRSFDRAYLPTPDERIKLFVAAWKRLESEGYIYLGMDHFALPTDSLNLALENGTLHRNFMGYATHKGPNLIALGASAISSVPEAMAQNEKELVNYQARIARGELPVERGIRRSREDQTRAWLIDKILCLGEVSNKELDSNWGVNLEQLLVADKSLVIEMEQDGILSWNTDCLKLSSVGRLFMRNVAMLFDTYLPAHRQSSQKVFSATV